jgi:hypothetical protein
MTRYLEINKIHEIRIIIQPILYGVSLAKSEICINEDTVEVIINIKINTKLNLDKVKILFL